MSDAKRISLRGTSSSSTTLKQDSNSRASRSTQITLHPDQNDPQSDVDEARARAVIVERNRIRETAQLPALSVEEQFQRMKAAYDQNRFEEFMRSPLKEVVEQKLLARMRKRGGDPEWLPTGFLSGGGYLFYVRVRKIMMRVYRMARR
jgi:hypothetical protein